MASTDDIFTNALRLPIEDRARLAQKLLVSLEDEEADPDAEVEWMKEIERRAREVLSGAVETEDAEEVLDRISARLRVRHR